MSMAYKCWNPRELTDGPSEPEMIEAGSQAVAAERFVQSKFDKQTMLRLVQENQSVRVRVWRPTDEEIVDVFVKIELTPEVFSIELVSAGKIL